MHATPTIQLHTPFILIPKKSRVNSNFFFDTQTERAARYKINFSIQFKAEEFLYLNQWGGISLLNVQTMAEKVLMSNTTYVSE